MFLNYIIYTSPNLLKFFEGTNRKLTKFVVCLLVGMAADIGNHARDAVVEELTQWKTLLRSGRTTTDSNNKNLVSEIMELKRFTKFLQKVQEKGA